MSVVTLNNNQYCDILKDAIKMSTGYENVDTLDLEGIVDTGHDETIIGSCEQFTKALFNVLIRDFFVDRKYTAKEWDVWFQMADQFGALLRVISCEPALTSVISGTILRTCKRIKLTQKTVL